jgi:DNA-binding XRE family transcriptional regulator
MPPANRTDAGRRACLRQDGHLMTSHSPHAGAGPESDGRPLRDIRAERLLSLRELARLAGVAPSTGHLIEAGRSTPRRSVIRLLSAVLGVDPRAVTEFRRALGAHAGSV